MGKIIGEGAFLVNETMMYISVLTSGDWNVSYSLTCHYLIWLLTIKTWKYEHLRSHLNRLHHDGECRLLPLTVHGTIRRSPVVLCLFLPSSLWLGTSSAWHVCSSRPSSGFQRMGFDPFLEGFWDCSTPALWWGSRDLLWVPTGF